MGKLKIILAETEETVLSALEIKFLYELKDTAELEIISSESYFNQYFSTQQRADILVCGQDLYSPELKRHDIAKIFLLCENPTPGGTADLGVERVNKYSNPQIVMDQVLNGTSLSKTKNDPLIILVFSACGGTGKTTVAMGISAAMAKDFKRILYINAERINTFQYRLHGSSSIPNAALKELSHPGEDVFQRIKHIIRKDGFDYLPPFPMAISSMGIPFSVYEKIAVSARNSREYDAIIVDTDSTFDEQKASLIAKADRVIVVLNQKKSSVFATNKLLSNMNCNDSSKYFFVCNAFEPHSGATQKPSDVTPKFAVSGSIGLINNIDEMDINQIAANGDIQKTAYLVV